MTGPGTGGSCQSLDSECIGYRHFEPVTWLPSIGNRKIIVGEGVRKSIFKKFGVKVQKLVFSLPSLLGQSSANNQKVCCVLQETLQLVVFSCGMNINDDESIFFYIRRPTR